MQTANSKIPARQRKRNKTKRSQWSGSSRSPSRCWLSSDRQTHSRCMRVNCPDDSKQDRRRSVPTVSLSEWESCQKDDDPVERRILTEKAIASRSGTKKNGKGDPNHCTLVTACSHSCRSSWKERKNTEEEESVGKGGKREDSESSSRCLNSSSSSIDSHRV